MWTLADGARWIGDVQTMYVRNCYITEADRLLGEGTYLNHQADYYDGAEEDGSGGMGRRGPVALAEHLITRKKTELIMGTKGIGKSMFLNYLIVRIVEKHRQAGIPLTSIVYISRVTAENIECIEFTPLGAFLRDKPIRGEYFISDSVDIAKATLGTSLLLEVVSDNCSKYNKFIDIVTQTRGKLIYMDEWSFDELLIIKPQAMSLE